MNMLSMRDFDGLKMKPQLAETSAKLSTTTPDDQTRPTLILK